MGEYWILMVSWVGGNLLADLVTGESRLDFLVAGIFAVTAYHALEAMI